MLFDIKHNDLFENIKENNKTYNNYNNAVKNALKNEKTVHKCLHCGEENALNSEKTVHISKLKYLIDSNLEKTENGNYILASNDCQTIVRHLKRIVNNEDYDVTCLHCGNDTPLYCEKCYQELISKNAELQLGNEKLKTLANETLWISPYYVSENYIPKQKIKDKIKELKAKYNLGDDYWQYDYDVDMNTIDILEELSRE